MKQWTLGRQGVEHRGDGGGEGVRAVRCMVRSIASRAPHLVMGSSDSLRRGIFEAL